MSMAKKKGFFNRLMGDLDKKLEKKSKKCCCEGSEGKGC